MSHFASTSRPELFVQVELYARNGKGLIEAGLSGATAFVEPDVAEQVDDGGGLNDGCVAQGKIADGPDVLLKLAGDAGAFAGMVAVVGPRRELIDEQVAVGGEEHLNGQQTFELECIGDGGGEVVCLRGERVGEWRGDDTPGEDLIVVVVPCGGVDLDFAAGGTSDENRDFAVERDGLLNDARTFAERLPRTVHFRFEIGFCTEADATLTATVIAASRTFAEASTTEFLDGVAQLVQRLNGAVRSEGEAIAREPEFLLDAVLDDGKEGAAGPHRSEGSGGLHAFGGDLLDLERDDIAAAGEVGGFAGVVPAGLDAAVNDEACGAGWVGIEHQGAVAHGAGSHRRHAPQLSASEDADGCARQENVGRRTKGRHSCASAVS